MLRCFSKVDMAGMVNLIAGERVVPELLQDALTPEAVSEEVVAFLSQTGRADDTRESLRRVINKLGGGGASRRAAAAIYTVAKGERPRAS